MTVEVILLALASTIRPTSIAAVYAILSTDAPRRFLTAYVLAGLAFTVAFGALIIWAFHGINVSSGSSHAKAVGEVAAGVLSLAFGVGVLTGRVGGPHAEDAPKPAGRWAKLLQHRFTLRTAIVAGPATHIPGLFYLLALNVIAAHDPKLPVGLAEVLVYNGIWFAIPLAALVVCIFEPGTARTAVGSLQGWTRQHTRTIVLVVSFVVGAVLTLRGALAW